MTSATLAVGQPPQFDFFKSRARPDELPDAARRQPVQLPRAGAAHPGPRPARSDGREGARSSGRSLELIQRYVERTDGHAFVLFTSYDVAAAGGQRPDAVAGRAEPGPLQPGRRHAADAAARAVQGRIRGACCWGPTASGRASMCPATP